MKKLILFLCVYLMVGCSKSSNLQKPSTIDTIDMNAFPYEIQLLLENNKPDVVSMDYLVDNPEDYVTDLMANENDFFVLVKGAVSSIDITDYSKEDLSIMENKDAANLLSNTTAYDYYLGDSEVALSGSFTGGEKVTDVEKGHEYYFTVVVREIGAEYSYLVLNAYEFK